MKTQWETDAILAPFNYEAEKHVIGCCLMNENAFEKVSSFLKAEHFYMHRHQSIYNAIQKHSRQKLKWDMLTLGDALIGQQIIDDHQDLFDYIDPVIGVLGTQNVDLHAQLIIDKWNRRKLIEAGENLISIGKNRLADDWQTITNDVRQMVWEVTQANNASEINKHRKKFDDALLEYFDHIDHKEELITTGLANLDTQIGGLGKGEFIVIGARPNMGKSWFLNWLALAAAKNDFSVVYFTSEMPISSTTKRFIATLSKISLSKILDRSQMTEQDIESEIEAYRQYESLPIYLDETPGINLTYQHIKDYCLQVKSKHGKVGLILQDYIQLIGDTSSPNYVNELAQISKQFKALAIEFNCPVVVLAQLNRGVESRNDKRPTMSDIRSCGQIEQDADFIWFLYRDSYYNNELITSTEKDEIEIIIAKARNRPTGTVECGLVLDRGEFRSF